MPLHIDPCVGSFDQCEVSIDKIVSTGPDDNKIVDLHVSVVNRTEKIWGYLRVDGVLVSTTGVVITDDTFPYHQYVIGPGDKQSFIRRFWGVNKRLLGEDPSKVNIVLRVVGCASVEVELEDIEVSTLPFLPVALKPREVSASLRVLAGSIFWRPNEASYHGGDFAVRVLLQNKSIIPIPNARVKYAIFDGRDEIVSASEEVNIEGEALGPASIVSLFNSGSTRFEPAGKLKLRTRIWHAELASIGTVANVVSFAN